MSLIIEDLLLIDKPKGITSFDVIRRLRKELGIVKLGHAGTLDPLASGLLLVAVGNKTKELNTLLKFPKTYEATILIGEERTTGDMEGEVVAQKSVKELNEKKVQEVLKEMKGTHTLPVPRYSAIKVKGEPLYKKARQGIQFEPPKKDMEIRDVRLLSLKKGTDRYFLEVILEVSSGAYIRSIAEEIGRRLGYPAVVKELRRIRIGDYDVKDARKI